MKLGPYLTPHVQLIQDGLQASHKTLRIEPGSGLRDHGFSKGCLGMKQKAQVIKERNSSAGLCQNPQVLCCKHTTKKVKVNPQNGSKYSPVTNQQETCPEYTVLKTQQQKGK